VYCSLLAAEEQKAKQAKTLDTWTGTGTGSGQVCGGAATDIECNMPNTSQSQKPSCHRVEPLLMRRVAKKKE